VIFFPFGLSRILIVFAIGFFCDLAALTFLVWCVD